MCAPIYELPSNMHTNMIPVVHSYGDDDDDDEKRYPSTQTKLHLHVSKEKMHWNLHTVSSYLTLLTEQFFKGTAQ